MPTPRMLVLSAFCLTLVWFAGCTRRPAAPPPAPVPDRPVILQPGPPQPPIRTAPLLPAWVDKGSGAYQEGSNRFFYGVGMANAASGNRILIRTAADNLARHELGIVLRKYLAGLAGNRVDGDDDGGMEQLIQDGLRKAVVTDHWTDDRDGRMYALCRLDLKQFKESLAHSSAFDMSQRSALLEMADRQHARMAAAP